MTFPLKRIYSLLLLLCLASGLDAAEKPMIKLAYIEFPPFSSTNPDTKEAEGYFVDAAEKIMRRAGYKWTGQALPSKRLAKKLVNGQIDVWMGLPTLPEFEGTTHIGQSVITTIELRAFHLSSVKPALKREDLIGKRVLILHGYDYGGLAKFVKDPINRIEYLEVPTHKSGLRALKTGHHDYLLDYKRPVDRKLDDIEIRDLQSHAISSLDLHFVVSRKTKNSEQLLADLESAYIALRKEGKLSLH